MQRRLGTLLPPAAVGLLAALMLLLGMQFVDTSRIHVSGLDEALNDQVGYINSARQFADTGQLDGTIVYPAVVWQNATRNLFYLPGHYTALAASFKLFGYGVWQSLLPNELALIIAAIAVYLTGRKLYGRGVGALGAFLFVIFPANIIFALTAMSEMTRIAAATVAFCAFVYLPSRWKLVGGPLLTIIPFLFRETGALLVIPMALLVAIEKDRNARWRAALLTVLTVVVLLVVYRSDLARGRPSLVSALVFDPSFPTIHTDAIANQALGSRTIQDWLVQLPAKALHDPLLVLQQAAARPEPSLEPLTTGILLLFIPMALVVGLWRREAFFLSTALMSLATLGLLSLLYYADLRGYMRWLLYLFPFQAIVMSAMALQLVAKAASAKRWRKIVPVAAGVILDVLFGLGAYGVSATAPRVSANDGLDDIHTACMEQIQPPSSDALIVAPYYFGDYALRHYPVHSSLIPANAATLDLLASHYSIGAIIDRSTDGSSLSTSAVTADDLKRAGLQLAKGVNCGDGGYYLVYTSGPGQK